MEWETTSDFDKNGRLISPVNITDGLVFQDPSKF